MIIVSASPPAAEAERATSDTQVGLHLAAPPDSGLEIAPNVKP